jgi:signal transduction histidine kinase/ligand-binding sensor domain-containing protein
MLRFDSVFLRAAVIDLPQAASVPGLLFKTALLLPFLAVAFAQGVIVDHWTNENGLPVTSVRGICQGPEGYLWLATYDGLVRFDGVRFVPFNKSNTDGILSDRFLRLVCGHDGGFWGPTEGQGLTHYSKGHFRTYTERDGLDSTSFIGLTEDEAGNLWVLTGTGLHRWDRRTDRFVSLDRKEYPYDHFLPSAPMLPVAAGFEQSGTGFYSRDAEGLHVFDQGRKADYRIPAEWRLADEITRRSDGSLWLKLENGEVARISGDRWSLQRRDQVAGLNRDSGIPPGSDRPNSSEWRQTLSTPGVLPDIRFRRAMLEDREGNIWIGTEVHGLYRLRERRIQVLSVGDGLPGRNLFTTLQTKDGAVWIGALGDGLSRYFNGRFTTVLPGFISSIAEDREGRLWVNGNPYQQQNGRLIQLAGGLGEAGGVKVTHEDRRGVMWLGGPEGLRRREAGGTWRLLTKNDGLAGNDFQVIVDARDGGMWAAGIGGLSYVGEDGRIRAWTEQDGLPSNHVRSLYEDSGGVLWIGTYDGGLGRFERGRLTRYSVRDGLFDKGVFQILEDGRGNLWFSCNRGIYRVNKQQLNDFAAGRTRSVTSFPYGRQDGMRNEECNGGFSPAGFKAPDGRLWFPTQDGVAIVDPEKIAVAPKPPPVLIESVLLDQGAVAIDQPVRIHPGQSNLEIQYTGLRLLNSAQIRFRYQLVSLDRDWVDVGARRTAYYQHVPPGSYTFRVTAAMADGAWNDRAAELSIVVLPPYYQTWWFRLLGALAVASLLWSYWRGRVGRWERDRAARQAFSRQLIASQENERKRIAGELHDSLGQRLVVIKSRALLLLQRRESLDSWGGEQVEAISAEVSEAVREVKEISYDLRPYRLDRLGLTTALQGMIETAADSSGIRFTTELDNIDAVLPGQTEINFYRIVQECVNNILRHSLATQASIRIKHSAERLELAVGDNGRGFTPGDAHQGFGLAGIRERTQLLAGKLDLQSIPGQGTRVTIVIDLLSL